MKTDECAPGVHRLLTVTYLTGRGRMRPADGHVPALPSRRRVDTPGHTPGHVSLFPESDRTLAAGLGVALSSRLGRAAR